MSSLKKAPNAYASKKEIDKVEKQFDKNIDKVDKQLIKSYGSSFDINRKLWQENHNKKNNKRRKKPRFECYRNV